MSNRIKKKPRVARQYELSQAQIEDNSTNEGIINGLPDMPADGLTPDNRPHINRAREVSKKGSKSTADFTMGLEAIDEAIFYYFENVIKPAVLSNGDMIDVPVIYGSGERWKMAQKDGFYRDKGGKVQTPLVMLKRESIEKRRDLGNKLDANNPQLYVTYQERFTNKNQYDRFSLLNNRIPQKEFTATVVPDYVNLVYSGIIWTDYISQLNKIIEAVNYASDAYWGDSERFKFMAQIDQFTNINEVSNDDGRIVRANFSLKLQGYIIPDNIQKKIKESNTRWFSKSQIVLDSKTTVLEDPISRRAQQLQSSPMSSGGGTSATESGGGTADDDWIIYDTYILSNRDVHIDADARIEGDLHINKSSVATGIALKVNKNNGSDESDIMLISRDNVPYVSVNHEGVFKLSKEFITFPTAQDGGFIFLDNEFYLGL